jgi:phosphate transport system substrate-binding protein
MTKWSELGVTVPGCESAEIIRVSRQSSSGTYEFFREHVLDKKDFKLGSRDMNGSKEVVELVGSTPCAIGYSGMGYATDKVKMLKVSQKGAAQSVAPTVENAQNKSYPIARPLFLYTLGEPEGATKKFLSWVLSEEGQKIVEQTGYVPVPAQERAKLN